MTPRTSAGYALIGACSLGLLLTGCSSSSPSSPSSSSSHGAATTKPAAAASTAQAAGKKVAPCSVLTPADVHAVLGGTVSTKPDNEEPSTPGCDFNVAGSVLGNYASVVVLTNENDPGVGTAVPGIGESTSYDDDTTVGQPILYLTNDGTTVDITYGSDTQVAADKQQFTIKYPADIKALTVALGKDAAPRI